MTIRRHPRNVTRLRRAIAVAALTAAAGAAAPLGIASAQEDPTIPGYVAEFPTKQACEEERDFRADQKPPPLVYYFCSSNGNPAGNNSNSYSLYERNHT